MINKLIFLLNELVNNGFTGALTINFFKGGITTINKDETIKL